MNSATARPRKIRTSVLPVIRGIWIEFRVDRAAARQGLAVLLGQVAQPAVVQVALAEPRVLVLVLVLQVLARLRVQRVRLLAQFRQWALRSLAQV